MIDGRDFARDIVMLGILCAVAGGLVVWLVPVIWGWLKPWIHAVTA
jgi:hypothetical protein